MNRSFFFFVFICASNLYYLVPSSSATPIVGGTPLSEHFGARQYISLHRLIYRPPLQTYEYFCSGSIISEKHILTAARCFLSNTGVEVTNLIQTRPKIIAGTIQRYGRGIERYIIRVFIPRVYGSGSSIGDISVGELSSKVYYNNYNIWIIGTSDLDPRNDVGVHASFVGFGATGNNHPTNIAGVCQLLTVVLWSREKCPADDSIICASSHATPVATACHGDTGAGLVVDSKIVGVLNYGPTNCNTNAKPIVFTRIKTFRSFIDHATNPDDDHLDMRVLVGHLEGSSDSHLRSPSPPRRT